MAQTAAGKNQLLRLSASYASLALAATLFIAKVAAWLLTGSVALLAAVADAGVDLAGAVVTLLAIQYARRPPDRGHRFGHAKAESLAALLQAVFLAAAAIALTGEAIQRVLVPQKLTDLDAGLAVMAASLIATVSLAGFETYVLRHGTSPAITASRAHHGIDAVIGVAVLTSLGLTRLTDWQDVDAVFGIGLALFILANAWPVAAAAFAVLLDRELSDENRRHITDVVLGQEQVLGLHDLRTRDAGDRLFVEFHLELEPELSVAAGHSIADRVERAVRAAFPTAEVLAHQEPAGLGDDRLDHRLG